MKLDFYSDTHVGLIRNENQDTILADGEHGLFIVADGMGGHRGGKTASQLAVQLIGDHLKEKLKTDPSASMAQEIEQTYKQTNKTIYNKGLQNIQLRGMGTTACLFLVQKNEVAYIGNVGDSRLYLFKENTLWQITEDHTVITDQNKANLLTGKNLSNEFFTEDNMLTKSVGFFYDVSPDIFKKKVQAKEVYLMCSDGLTGLASHPEIENILIHNRGQKRVQECIKLALKKGGSDNISVIIIEIS